jgi:hypothetical protein
MSSLCCAFGPSLSQNSAGIRQAISSQMDFLSYTAISSMEPRQLRQPMAKISEVTDYDPPKYKSLCGSLIAVFLSFFSPDTVSLENHLPFPSS